MKITLYFNKLPKASEEIIAEWINELVHKKVNPSPLRYVDKIEVD